MERSGQLRSQVGQVAPLTGEIAVPRCTVLLPPLAAGGVDLRTREQEGSEGTWDGNGVRDREASGEPRARPHAAATQGIKDGRTGPAWLAGSRIDPVGPARVPATPSTRPRPEPGSSAAA